MAYDSAATRTRLLDAAYDEFVERGLAGARVDRISAAAAANKQAIYAYFGSKDGLFDAVLDARLKVLAELVPFTPGDLPGYIGALYDQIVADRGLVRLTQWKALERPNASPGELAAHLAKAGELAEARDVDAEYAMDVLMLTLSMAQAWSATAPEIRDVKADPERVNRHRDTLIRAVTALAEKLF
ncbi:TetR family transcriptional regulator [Winogradskya consettensis]|uniref:TetR family regulatory protein n=1 Tax=Winogradskya consettensis TaxID=113560 RepID=A0A919VX79_9ACTN|nr:TetR family transcriptional regulator [Actinoplanes consettensis]GIM80381.1 putative TetR family regulatory protein [Actinoplanes consettensis]